MAESDKDSGVINVQPPAAPMAGLLNQSRMNKLIDDIVIPTAIKEIKNAAGIETNRKELTKSGFQRTVLSLKDFWQGVWWTIPAIVLSLGLVAIILAVIKKVLAV